MNNTNYEEMEGIRRSELWLFKKSPLHYKWQKEHPTDPTPAMVFGQAMHKYLLEPETFADEFAIVPAVDRRTKVGREQFNDFLGKNSGKTFITEDDMNKIGAMKMSLLENEEVRELFAHSKVVEMPYTWTDAATGEKCKVKADMVISNVVGFSRPCIIDYKTTNSCADGAFEKSCRMYGYDFQSGMYTEGINICTLEEHGFIFIAQEKEPPYASRVYYCSDYFIDRGKRIFHELLDVYHSCRNADSWHGYESTELFGEDW